ncbi:TVP38/TMEM64 family protein [Paenibacillus ginsengarvi]|uniref:TVP38/TMEM64 family membrane protein n=1 Tax=Paenibacillus ginsengarvi TaxID=400777 RepID=A0A3B0CGG9_9BACL|nr:TVP38/TMEM64 family protein [Paenibacillus ginsengarvi]RKN84280.1 TVP38/TMEM64 family protein [Paenibacillus ginsengarvi]
MGIADFLSTLTEDQLKLWLEQFRSYGPLPGMLLTFLKSFVPPLPTLLIVGVNAAVYGLWLGFLYSWIGMVCGCLLTFAIVRKIAGHPYLQRMARKPKVQRGMLWVRRNAFSYVFVLSLFPVGPFVAVNMAAGLAGMSFRSFALAVSLGKAIMIFIVSYIGYDLSRYIENPLQLLYIVAFIVISLLISRKIEAKFVKHDVPDETNEHQIQG